MHKKTGCPYQKPPKVEVMVQEEVQVETRDLGQMTLLERINLLDHPTWTPAVCSKCSQQNLGHIEVECPQYEYCHWCKTRGSYRFVKQHASSMYKDKVLSNDDECDHNLWYD
jgi:hypothetical protein